jgi:acetyltransferase-like isoleucine patch superfamily enzyme
MLKRISLALYNKLVLLRISISRFGRVHPGATLHASWRLRLGSGVSIKNRVLLDCNAGEISIGHGCWINTDVEIQSGGCVVIGDRTTIQRRASINGNVTLGQECIISPNVFISSGTHVFDAFPELSIRQQELRLEKNLASGAYDRPVIIGNDVWIGVNSVILPGVTISDHVVIGANSVVTKDVSSHSVVAGIPAKNIKGR